MNPRDKLKRLTHLFMKKLRQGRLLEIVVPRISQLDLVGIIEVDEDYDEMDTIVRKSLLSSETSKCYAQLMAIAGLVAEQLYCKSLLGNIAYWFPLGYLFMSELSVDRTTSQRDVYYCLKHLFKNQVECNKCILDLGLVLGLKRCKYHYKYESIFQFAQCQSTLRNTKLLEV